MRYRFIFSVLLCALVSGCTNVFYQPSRQKFYEPAEGADGVPEDIRFTSLDGTKLHGWFFPSKSAPAKGTVIQFHGNAENMTSHFTSLIWVIEHGYNLFTFDYRGYGESEGSPFPQAVNLDALAALQEAWTRDGNRERSLIVYGQSLGGTIALRALEDLDHRAAIRAIVIESSFLSYKRIAREKLSNVWLTWPLQWMAYILVSDKYSPKKKLQELSTFPLLVLHGRSDVVVPFHWGEEIYAKYPGPKCFWGIDTNRHAHLMNIEKGTLRDPMLSFFETQKCPSELSVAPSADSGK